MRHIQIVHHGSSACAIRKVILYGNNSICDHSSNFIRAPAAPAARNLILPPGIAGADYFARKVSVRQFAVDLLSQSTPVSWSSLTKTRLRWPLRKLGRRGFCAALRFCQNWSTVSLALASQDRSLPRSSKSTVPMNFTAYGEEMPKGLSHFAATRTGTSAGWQFSTHATYSTVRRAGSCLSSRVK